jgi:hypothetical protein
MADQQLRMKYQTPIEKFVVTLLDDRVEVAKPGFLGGLLSDTQTYYDEIVAVYRYRVPDWQVLFIIFLLALIFVPLGLGIYFGMQSPEGGIITWSCGVLFMAYYAYRGFIRRKDMVRVVSIHGRTEFVCNNEQFFTVLLSRLKVIDTARPLTQSSNTDQAVLPPIES